MAEPSPEIPKPKRRILAVQPIGCGRRWGYWYRDLGLVVRTLREQGHDAWLVLFPSEEGPPEADEPVIIAPKEELENPAWWKKQAPDAVIVNFWGAGRWEGIRAAARQATPHLMEKLDTAGIYSPRIWPWRYFYEGYWQARDGGVPAVVAAARLFVRSWAVGVFPGLLDEKRAGSIARMPVVAAESPLAVERTRRYLREFGGRDTRVLCIPHAVDETDLAGVSVTAKENKIVSVGRWETHQKNFPLLMEVLGRFLAIHAGWSADIFGKLPADAGSRLSALPESVASRIVLAGPRPHEELARYYGAAKIFLVASRHESFNIAAAEALCCGCGVVGPPEIASMHFFTERNSGTTSSHYSAGGLLDALCVEAGAWQAGRRDPEAIAAEWRALVGAQAVTRAVLEALDIKA